MTKKILYKLNKVWLVQWIAHGKNEKKLLNKLGIKNKYIDIINARKNFDNYIIDYGKNIYRLYRLSFLEKASFADYNKGKINYNNFFNKNIPLSTHYHSQWYKDLTKNISSDKYKNLVKKYSNYPQYVIIGHNPSLEIIKVSNFTISIDLDGKEFINWDRPLMNGKILKEEYHN